MKSTDDYVIAVRSYDRPEMFRDMTYKMLSKQYSPLELEKKLHIFVANYEELERYSDAMGDLPYAEIAIVGLGGSQAVRGITEHFIPGRAIVFMDDDLEEFFEFVGTPEKSNLVKSSTNLAKYIEDGFKTISKTGSAFSFSFYQNDFYLKGKPWKEFRPFNLPGGFFGAFNDRELIPTKHSHMDDMVRTCKYIDKFGGIVVYHWGGFKTATGINPGGMQSSGDRGDSESRKEKLWNIANEIFETEPSVRRYCNSPRLIEYSGMPDVRLKPEPSIAKINPYRRIRWEAYFQENEEESNLEKFFD